MTNDLFRDLLDGRIPMPSKPKPPTIGDAFQSIFNMVGDVAREIAAAYQPLIESLQDLGLIETPQPADPRERALWAQLHRGTGPAPDPLRNRGRVNRYKTRG